MDLPNPRIKQGSPALQADFLPTELSEKPTCRHTYINCLPFPTYIYIGLPRWCSGKESTIGAGDAEIQETRVPSLGQEDPLESEMATYSNILAWKIPRTEEPCGLQSMGPQRASCTHTHVHKTITWLTVH